MNTIPAAQITILHRPVGDAPAWVRDAWIGMTLPSLSTSPRPFRGVSILDGGSALARLIALLRGKSFRISGYAVPSGPAVEMLAQVRPDAADWWRTNAPGLLTGNGLLIFDADCCEVRNSPSGAHGAAEREGGLVRGFRASPGRAALLWLLATLLIIADCLLFPGEGYRPVSSVLYLSGTPVLAALLAAWALRLGGATLHLIGALSMISLVIGAIVVATKFVEPALGAGEAYWATIIVLLPVAGFQIDRTFGHLRSRARRLSAIALVAMTFLSAGLLPNADPLVYPYGAQLRSLVGLPEPSYETDDGPSPIEADRLWGAQPRLMEAQLSALRPRTAGRANVYALAVAGSGTQALFSREAKEALRVAGLHFGEAGRGGIILSNAQADELNTPLATRDTIAASLKGIAARSDRGKDIAFIFLTSHGSKTAELLSNLSDYHSLQPISARTTAAALADAGISRRVIVVSACYAASWIPVLASEDTIVIAAAARDRTSFGCDDSREMTLFGESFLGSLATPGVSLSAAFEDAKRKIAAEEAKQGVTPSLPQAFVGRNMQGFWQDVR